MRNNRITMLMLLAIVAGIFYPNLDVSAQFTLDNPVCGNEKLTTAPPVGTRAGAYVDVHENTAVISGDNNFLTTYAHIFEFSNNEWTQVQTVSFSDLSGVQSSASNDVTIYGNTLIVCPAQFPNQNKKPKVYEKDASGIFVEVGTVPVNRSGADFYKVKLIGDELVISSKLYISPFTPAQGWIDVYKKNASGSFVFNRNLWSGIMRAGFEGRWFDFDGDHIVITPTTTDYSIFSRDALGNFSIEASFTGPSNSHSSVSNGLVVVGSVLYRENASGGWDNVSSEWPGGATIVAMDGNYITATTGSFVSQKAYLYEYNGSNWVQFPETEVEVGGFGWWDYDLEGRHMFFGNYNNVGDDQNQYVVYNCEEAPACHTANFPANGATEIQASTNISWTNKVDATGFRISIGTTAGGTDIVNNFDVGNATSYNPGGNYLPFDATVYVTLTPYNVAGSALGCSSTSFSTVGEITVFNCPNFVSYRSPDPNRPPPPGGYGPNWNPPTATTFCTATGGCTPATIPGFTLVGQLNDKAYYVSDVKEKWLDAKAIAQSNGGDLATINDQATNDFLQVAIPAGENIAHIGINDEAIEGVLDWVSGDAVTYTNFAANEPSDSEIEDNGMLKLNGKWRLRKDTGKRRYFAEIACGGACPGTPIAGYTYVGNEDGFDYYFSDVKETYANAQALSAGLGGSLATIRSQAANDLLVANNQGLKAYIGINDRDTEGTYVWDSGAPVTYENWANNYPDANAVEDFGAIRSATGLWAMNVEKNKFYFMEVDCIAGGVGTVTITQTAGDPPNTVYPPTTTDSVFQVVYEITDACGNLEICSFFVGINQSPPSLVGQNTPTDFEQQKGATGVTPTGNISTHPKSSEVASLKNSDASIAVFPNPASDRFTIQLNNFNGQKQTLRIYDFTGKVVLEKRSNNQDARFEINTKLHSGIYSVVITSDEGELVTKQVIIK